MRVVWIVLTWGLFCTAVFLSFIWTIHTHAYMYARAHTHANACTHMHAHTHTHACTHTHTTHTHTTYKHTHTCKHTCTHARTHARTHTHTHTHYKSMHCWCWAGKMRRKKTTNPHAEENRLVFIFDFLKGEWRRMPDRLVVMLCLHAWHACCHAMCAHPTDLLPACLHAWLTCYHAVFMPDRLAIMLTAVRIFPFRFRHCPQAATDAVR